MSQVEFECIKQSFETAGVPFQVFEHEAVRTSAQAAAVRGASLGEGVKALVLKFSRLGKEFYCVAAIPADCKLDFKKAKAVLQAQSVEFAKELEVLQQTGCEPGGVPPFCHKEKLAVLADPAIFEKPSVEFNAGLKTVSVRVSGEGFRKVLEAYGAAFIELSL